MRLTITNFILVILIFNTPLNAQNWQLLKGPVSEKGKRDIVPETYLTATVDDEQLKKMLWEAPLEQRSSVADSDVVLDILMPDAEIKKFRIVQYEMMEAKLQQHFDDIRTFRGVAIDDPYTRIYIDYTVHGLRAVISTPQGKAYIDHYQRNDKNTKVVYWRKDYKNDEPFICGVDDEFVKQHEGHRHDHSERRQGDCKFYTVRLANAVTGEYSAFHGASTAGNTNDQNLVHSAVVTSINRVNEVYEIDLGFRVILVDNNQQIYYYNGSTDPYDNNSGGAMLGQNQTNIDNVIGTTNYDLGHVFSTGGGGIASLGSICSTANKARGVTGQNSPVADPFDIDYVAHEMGHQFGANHTQNNSCNRVSAAAREPGSASTIMGYAGICPPNVQNNSDPYYHAYSLQEITQDGSFLECATEITGWGNTAPAVSLDATSYNIPHSTPFVLTANATDAEGDAMTYCWEQMDNQIATMPPQSTNTGGPTFRSLDPVTSPSRYFPDLPQVLAGGTDAWEVLPSVARNMSFRVTVRDFHSSVTSGGCTSESDLTLAVSGSAGPFAVTSHTAASTWLVGQSIDITWDVANTNMAPINCTEVEIIFSAAGDFLDMAVIATTANDGSASIIVPNSVTTTGRYMIKAVDNVFYDTNEGVITIESTDPTFLLSISPSELSVCQNNNAQFNIESTSILNFSTPINLSANNLPQGSSHNISPNPLSPGQDGILKVFDLNTLGDYNFTVQGQAGAQQSSAMALLKVVTTPSVPSNLAPADGATGISTTPMLSWSTDYGDSHEYQLASMPNDMSVIESATINTTSVQVNATLNNGTTYYWRVKSSNSCGTSQWSAWNSFETQLCFSFAPTDLPISIGSSGQVTINSSIDVLDDGVISDLNILGLQGIHTYMSDLNFSLQAPDGTSMEFWDQPCGSQNNFNINFDDEAEAGSWPCPPTDAGTYQPSNSLTFFDNKSMAGEWTLTVFDDANADGGALQNYQLNICLSSYCDLTVSSTSSSGAGSFAEAWQCATEGSTIYLTTDINNGQISLSDDLIVDKNISIVSLGNNIQFNFAAGKGIKVNTDKSLEMKAFRITNSGTDVIVNNGSVLLEDMVLENAAGTFVNNNTTNGQLQVKGTTEMLRP